MTACHPIKLNLKKGHSLVRSFSGMRQRVTSKVIFRAERFAAIVIFALKWPLRKKM